MFSVASSHILLSNGPTFSLLSLLSPYRNPSGCLWIPEQIPVGLCLSLSLHIRVTSLYSFLSMSLLSPSLCCFCVWVFPGAPCLSKQACWHFCPASCSFELTVPPRLPYARALYQGGTGLWRGQSVKSRCVWFSPSSLPSGSWISPAFDPHISSEPWLVSLMSRKARSLLAPPSLGGGSH